MIDKPSSEIVILQGMRVAAGPGEAPRATQRRRGSAPSRPSPRYSIATVSGQSVGQAAAQLSKVSVHADTFAVCVAAHACTQAARFLP